ncbi:hypothetical protein V6C27_02945 [Peptococcaceae bacterium 1198_IL3148]
MEIKNIIDAISIKLNQKFGDSCRIYVDEVPQGFKAPVFLILFLSLEQKKQIGKRWHITTLFNVQYFPSGGHVDASNHALKVQQVLKEITLLNGATMLGTGANSEIVDGVAHSFIHFNFFLQEQEEKIFMETLGQHSRLRG